MYTANVTAIIELAPAVWLCFVQLGFGIAALWLSLKKGTLRGRDRKPWPNQRFGKACFFVLGTAMALLSFWGLYVNRY
jgi:hypothetical protein